MKRILAIALLSMMLLNLAACNKNEEKLGVTNLDSSVFQENVEPTNEDLKKESDGSDSCATCTLDKRLWVYGDYAYINGCHEDGAYRVPLAGGKAECLSEMGSVQELYGQYLIITDEKEYQLLDLETQKWISWKKPSAYAYCEPAGEWEGKLYFFGGISEPGKEAEATYFCDTVDLKTLETERISLKEEYREALLIGDVLYFKRTALVDGSMKGWLYKTVPGKWEEERLCEIAYNAYLYLYKDLLVFAARDMDPACYDLKTGDYKVLKDFEYDASNAWVHDRILICSYNKGYWAYDLEVRTEIDPVQAGVSPDQAYGNIHPDGMVQEWTYLFGSGIVNYGINYAEFLYQGQKQRLEISIEDCLTHGSLWKVAINENGAAWLKDWSIYVVDWESETIRRYDRKSFEHK